MNRTKILILGDINSIHLQKWILGLSDDFEIAVFSLDPLQMHLNHGKLISEKVKVVSNEQKTTGRRFKITYLNSLRPVQKLYFSFQPDVVHAHYATSYGLLGKLLRPKRFFISVWGSDVYDFPKKSWLTKLIFKRIIARADRLFSTSKAMANELQKYTHKQIVVIPFGIDIDLFRPIKAFRNSNPIIGTVKSLEHVYGIDRLIAVTALLKKEFPTLQCHIYGEGSARGELELQIKENRLEDSIFLKGLIRNSDLPEIYNSMDVFCVLSRQESFGVAAVEAMACEIPVVATRVGGLPEVVQDGVAGLIAEENVSDAANKIKTLLLNQDLRHTLGRNGRMIVLKHYNWLQNIEIMKNNYLN